MPESNVRVIANSLGGAFGGKFVLYEPLVALAAQNIGRPVSLVLSRQEEMLASNPASPGQMRVKVGAKADGTFTALEADIVFDGGSYPSSPVGLAAVLMGSIYRFSNFALNGLEVLTFKPSGGAYRAPGTPQAVFAIESVVDEVARKLEVDPLELRLQNAAQPGDLMVHEKPWPHMGMTEVLKTLQNHPAWQNREAARAAGRGLGIAVGGWPGATEPSSAACTLGRDGWLEVHLGAVDMTGTNTGFTLLAAEAFGIEPEKVRVISGDTMKAVYAGAAGGSKITYTVGPAVIQAAREARTQTLAIAAEMLEADPADLEIVEGQVQVRGVPDRGVPLGEIATKTMQFGGQYAPVFGHGRHVDTTQSPAFCAQLAEVEVDRETGIVGVHKLVVVQDVGRAINPLTIEGQMMGGATQGLGWALYERMVYDDYGQLLTASWLDYTVPQFEQGASKIETVLVEVPSEHGPFGARGVGEPPIIPTAGAVGNAIFDATGVRLTDLPMTPPRVLAALSS
jgi:CO/xanthine dehydrogenase Mo-binding subunit